MCSNLCKYILRMHACMQPFYFLKYENKNKNLEKFYKTSNLLSLTLRDNPNKHKSQALISGLDISGFPPFNIPDKLCKWYERSSIYEFRISDSTMLTVILGMY